MFIVNNSEEEYLKMKKRIDELLAHNTQLVEEKRSLRKELEDLRQENEVLKTELWILRNDYINRISTEEIK